MARARTRADWPITVHRYDVWPLPDGIPEVLWVYQRRLREAWNHLVGLGQGYREDYQGLVEQAAQPVAASRAAVEAAQMRQTEAKAALAQARQRLRTRHDPALALHEDAYRRAREETRIAQQGYRDAKAEAKQVVPRDAKRVLRTQFESAVYQYVQSLDLPWGDRGHLHARFLRAHQAWLVGRARPPRPASGPLTSVHVHHQITNTGFPVEDLIQGSRRQLALWPDPDERRSRPRYVGRFRIGDEWLRFGVTLHRPFPTGAMVKRVMLTAKRVHGPFWWHGRRMTTRWAWSLAVMIEVPPSTVVQHAWPGRFAAIDLGWRLIDERDGQTVRIGVLYDGGFRPLCLPPRLLGQWRFCAERQAEMDGMVERMKTDLPKRLMPTALSLEGQAVFAAWHAVRLGGLRRLHRACLDADPAHPTTCWLTTWLSRHGALAREVAGLRRRFLLARREQYRVWASQLCREYGRIILEDLDLRKIASEEDQTPALAAGQQYRQCVALSEFRQAIRLAARKAGTVVDETNPAYTTLTCHRCGGVVVGNTGSLHLTCPRGHTWDQDENAAINLWQRASGVVAGEGVA